MKGRKFRVGDRVSVHNLGLARLCGSEGAPLRGRVICNNRKARTGLCVVVLVDLAKGEYVETFTADGRRGPRDKTYITLGWPSE